MLTCRETSKLVSESLDRKLPWHRRLSVAFHLSMCRLCSRNKGQMLFLGAALKRYCREIEKHLPDAEVTLSPEARSRIRDLLQDTENSS